MTFSEFEKSFSALEKTVDELEKAAEREHRPDGMVEASAARAEMETIQRQFFSHRDAWDAVELARHKDRPYTLDYLPRLTSDFLELHGDRLFGDDGAMVGGLATVVGIPVVLVGQQKGRDLKQNLKRNFGYVRPEGYRKALRLMRLGEKFRRPVVTLVDTPGADPNVSSEERGISESIARNLMEMAALRTPTVAVVIGEGGSGGALGIAVADRVLMLEHAIYSVIAPEGCASILWRDPTRSKDAAIAMRVTAQDALSLGLVDEVLPEPLGGAHRDPDAAGATIREAVVRHLNELMALSVDELRTRRYARFRAMASLTSAPPPTEGRGPQDATP